MKKIQYSWILIFSIALITLKCSDGKNTQQQTTLAEAAEELEEEDYDDEEEDLEEADTVSYDDWELEEELEEIDTTSIQ